MITILDQRYVENISFKLDVFKIKSQNPYKANFRCPYCGDSQKSKYKARGWFFEDDSGNLRFYCFNCFIARNFYQFLKDQDFSLYTNYVSERYVNKFEQCPKPIIKQPKPAVFCDDTILNGLQSLHNLDDEHPARIYVEKVRQIPKTSDIYYTSNFSKWLHRNIDAEKYSVKKFDPRIVFPFRRKDKTVFGVSGRALDPDSNMRYMTEIFDENEDKIFGLENIDFSKRYFIVEGQIDSLLLNNALAMSGASGFKSNKLENIENAIVVLDNEYRNSEIMKQAEKVIESGIRICIWPKTISGKDINEMILNETKNIEEIIEQNSWSGLMARAKLSERRKS